MHKTTLQSYAYDYAYGMLQPNRHYTLAEEYKFGFNGKENDDEVYGVKGSFQDYGMRMYDTRLARFASADPLIIKEQQYPELTSYQFASNTPIQAIDLDGLEALVMVQATSKSTGHTVLLVANYTEIGVNDKGEKLYRRTGYTQYDLTSNSAMRTRFHENTDVGYVNLKDVSIQELRSLKGFDGIVQITNNDVGEDKTYTENEIKTELGLKRYIIETYGNINNNIEFNLSTKNCAWFVSQVLARGAGINNSRTERIGRQKLGSGKTKKTMFTPNKIFQDLKKLGLKIIKGNNNRNLSEKSANDYYKTQIDD